MVIFANQNISEMLNSKNISISDSTQNTEAVSARRAESDDKDTDVIFDDKSELELISVQKRNEKESNVVDNNSQGKIFNYLYISK